MRVEDLEIRAYRLSDLPSVVEVFKKAVFLGAKNDYTAEQLRAWANEPLDLGQWADRLSRNKSRVAEVEETVVGFAEMTGHRHIEMLFVHPDFHRKGVASALLSHFEVAAALRGSEELTTEASRTARPFFETHGYKVVTAQEIERQGVLIQNFTMKKTL
ncbi:MAG: GNAT family N-acetyltransferase [Kiloniellales bacterium]|nr:GNAT family N-acetyltransferase [Kiloniellales bacterium]